MGDGFDSVTGAGLPASVMALALDGNLIEMTTGLSRNITFARLPHISTDEVFAHMSDPPVAQHMPLLAVAWTRRKIVDFIAAKDACWHRDGFGHWAILNNGAYVGWGGFQKEGDDWDYGLVLKPGCFGLIATLRR